MSPLVLRAGCSSLCALLPTPKQSLSSIFVYLINMNLRQRLLAGAVSYGPLLLSDSPIVAEMLASVGYDHIIVDHEHSVTDVRSSQSILQAIQSTHAVSTSTGRTRTEPIVRLPDPYDETYMKKVLDSLRLPGGVLVPMVEDAETAERVVASTRYSNELKGIVGSRGCAAPFVRASSWGVGEDYFKQLREDLLVMVQVETTRGVEAIPEIAKVRGIDAIFLGPYDLSCSIGKMGMFQDKEVRDLILRAESRVLEAGTCLLAGFRPPGRDVNEMFDSGYSLVSGSTDVSLLMTSAMDDLSEIADRKSNAWKSY